MQDNSLLSWLLILIMLSGMSNIILKAGYLFQMTDGVFDKTRYWEYHYKITTNYMHDKELIGFNMYNFKEKNSLCSQTFHPLVTKQSKSV